MIGFYQGHGLVTRSTLLNNTPPQGYTWSGEEIDQDSSNVQAREHMARKLVKDVEELTRFVRFSLEITAVFFSFFDILPNSVGWSDFRTFSCQLYRTVLHMEI